MSYRVRIADVVARFPRENRDKADAALHELKTLAGEPIWIHGDELLTDSPDAIVTLIDAVTNPATSAELRELRLRRVRGMRAEGFTLSQIAERLGITKQAVHDFLNRRRKKRALTGSSRLDALANIGR